MATTTILTNKGVSIINKAIKDGAKCVISRVITSTHYENVPTDLSAKAPHWWDGAEGMVTGLSLVNASLDVKVHWEAQQDAQPVKSIGLMVKRDGDEKDYLLYAESYSNTAVTLDHALDKIFSLPINAPAGTFDAIGNTLTNEMNEELAGIGGGGEVPANMMTTNTAQTGLSGTKTWTWENHYDTGTVEEPQDGDMRVNESISIDAIGVYVDEGDHIPLVLDSKTTQYFSKDGWIEVDNSHLKITTGSIRFNDAYASWSSIINAARAARGFEHAPIRNMGDGSIGIGDVRVEPNSEIEIGPYAKLKIDSNGKIASVHSKIGVLDISAAVFDIDPAYSAYRVIGIVNWDSVLSFDPPITPADGQEIYIHWALYENS